VSEKACLQILFDFDVLMKMMMECCWILDVDESVVGGEGVVERGKKLQKGATEVQGLIKSKVRFPFFFFFFYCVVYDTPLN
jgi:hypothetical protein